MALVYLRPALKELKTYYLEEFNENINNITDVDRAAIISMAYDKFSDRVISNGDSDDNLTITMRIGDIYYPLIKDGLGLSVAERIYHYMIEIKYANNPDEQARWVAEAEKMLNGFGPLDPDSYENFYKAYLEAQKKYGRYASPATAYDYAGEVLTPEDFESTHKFDEARDRLARYLRSKFSTSSFFRYKDNADIAARNYMIVSKMVEDAAFSDITEIYCSDVELVTHSYGYESNEIMLADFSRAELNDEWGTDTDTDLDGLNDNVEAYEEELLDIRSFVEDYCEYNNIAGEEKERYMREYGTTKVYNFISNPVLPDTDFDGRNDDVDSKPFDNKYKVKVETDAFYGIDSSESSSKGVNMEYVVDYRYFYMNSADYYAELAKMSLILSNMIKNKKVDGDNLPKKMLLTSEHDIIKQGMAEILWLMGFHINSGVRNLGDVYSDCNVCKYAFGSRDVRYLNNTRNVISITIGDIDNEEKLSKLKVNYDGSKSVDIDSESMHHVGFEITADRLYEKFSEWESSLSGDKVYWITGYGTGGSIANLFAKRLIDEVGYRNVYAYTFQGLNTVNLNNCDSEVFENSEYKSIFNIINDDDYEQQIYSDKENWYMYGSTRRERINQNNAYKNQWKDITKHAYKYSISIYNRLIDTIKYIRDLVGMIFGHTGTEISNMEDIIKNRSNIINNLNAIDITGPGIIIDSNERMPRVDDKKIYKDETSGDKRDGYPFSDYEDYFISNEDYNNSNEATVKIKDFMYSNYTLPSSVQHRDINYVKFWYNGNTNIPRNPKGKVEQLFQYEAGDMTQKTMCTFGDYYNKSSVVKYRNKQGGLEEDDKLKEDNRLNLGNGNKLVTIKNRIIAAFPPALFSEDKDIFNEVKKDMHKVENYALPDETEKDGGNFNRSSEISGKDDVDTYKLVDVVIEDSNSQQFVVPFIVIDSKSVHLLPSYKQDEKIGMFSNLTDNRYGQVLEKVTDTNPTTYNYYKYAVNDGLVTGDRWFNDEEKRIADAVISWGGNEYTNLNKTRTYYNKDVIRKVHRMSPIEPYIKVIRDANGEIIDQKLNEKITSVICGKGVSTVAPNCRIISMRIYDGEKCAESDGTPIVGTWDDRQGEIRYDPNYLTTYYDPDINPNIIVNYK